MTDELPSAKFAKQASHVPRIDRFERQNRLQAIEHCASFLMRQKIAKCRFP